MEQGVGLVGATPRSAGSLFGERLINGSASSPVAGRRRGDSCPRLRDFEHGEAVDHGGLAVEHQPGDAGLLCGLEDRGQIRLRRNAVPRGADVDEAAGIGRLGLERQIVIGQSR